MRRVMVYFEHGLGEIALARSLDCAVTEDKGHAERSVAGTKVHDGSLFEFQAKGPAAFWRALPLLASGALFPDQPIHQLLSNFSAGTESLGDFCRRGFFGFVNKRVRSHRIIPDKQTAVIRGRDGVVERG